ncbi:hypothetical protein UFOVP23_31 [uncultured Caudovirales phage]|uniref:Uncharacterized protein n=1 Tax=uncultured Caudovirales phage TaxID=2100421 RepID=A0A6J5T7R7_9CAUD|nr:hypothetical protein UFOVP23_31 [uncultured Caudovirales phage]
MSKVSRFLKSAGRKFAKNPLGPIALGEKLLGSGKSAAKRAENDANKFAAEATAERTKLEAKTKKEKLRAQKLAVRGLRSKRSASYFKPSDDMPTNGSATIG